MKLDFKKIVDIKSINDLKKFKLYDPLFNNNYLFHYLIIFNKLDILKLDTFPIYKEDDNGLNGFFLAAKYNNIPILKYLIKNYDQYIYNRNLNDEQFINYLDYNNIPKLLDLDLDWNILLENKLDELYYNLDYQDLKLLFENYKPRNHYLNYIILNPKLKSSEIIYFLNLFIKDINQRDTEDQTIIFQALFKKNIKIINFILSLNVDIDYYTIVNTIHPLKTAINMNFMEAADLIWNKIKKTFNYELTNRNLENIAHFLLKKKITDKLAIEILCNCSSFVWTQKNVDKITPLELLIEYDFDKFNFLIKNKEVNFDFQEKYEKNNNINKWYTLFKKLKKYKENNNIVLQKNNYSHINQFQSRFKDMSFYLLHLKDKYKNLFFPSINDIQLSNLSDLDEINIEWPDSMLENNNIFPWIICYQNDEEYWIHQQLNNIINTQRRIKKYDFGFCYLSLRTIDNGLHANILIYDFNNFTIERFDPYGNTVCYDKNLDEILEEELTWNTGLKYIKPSDYMPVSGFQTVSDELNPLKQKVGDFGGYCLAWCTWYLEHRILNKNINPSNLVKKLLRKLSSDKDSFMETIRNYANKLNESRLNYLKEAGIDNKIISNIAHSVNVDNQLSNFIFDEFKKSHN
jgi:hypothetical protein